jgi:hypothetical protein
MKVLAIDGPLRGQLLELTSTSSGYDVVAPVTPTEIVDPLADLDLNLVHYRVERVRLFGRIMRIACSEPYSDQGPDEAGLFELMVSETAQQAAEPAL